MSALRPDLEWTETHLTIGKTRFLVSGAANTYLNSESSDEEMVLAKDRSMVEDLLEATRDLDIRHIVDVGIFKGGSTALLAALFNPDRISAIELSTERVGALDDFIVNNDLHDVVHTYYGFDQADTARLCAIVEADHGDEPLDLVTDDASHLYRETRETFRTLFPLVRPGGRYIIEDWAWAHFDEELWQAGGGWFHDRPALTNLAVELLMTIGTAAALIERIVVKHNSLEIVRGDLDVGAAPIELEKFYRNRGLPFRPLI